MKALFANIFTVSVDHRDFVLDFGSFFPDGPGGPAESDFHTRVVLNADDIEEILRALETARKQRDLRRDQLPARPASPEAEKP